MKDKRIILLCTMVPSSSAAVLKFHKNEIARQGAKVIIR